MRIRDDLGKVAVISWLHYAAAASRRASTELPSQDVLSPMCHRSGATYLVNEPHNTSIAFRHVRINARLIGIETRQIWRFFTVNGYLPKQLLPYFAEQFLGRHFRRRYALTAQKIAAQSAYLLKEVSLVLRGKRAQDPQPQPHERFHLATPVVSARGTYVMLLTVRKWQFRYGTKKILGEACRNW
jgi:hypothetical protein